MHPETAPGREVDRRRVLEGFLLALVVAAVVSWLLVLVGADPAIATNHTTVEPIHNGTPSGIVDNETWMEGRERPSLHNISSYVADIGPFVIGTGDGSGIPGALLTGFLVFAGVISIIGPSRVGAVAGGVIGVVTVSVLVELALAPMWMLMVLLVAVGFLLAGIYLRVTR